MLFKVSRNQEQSYLKRTRTMLLRVNYFKTARCSLSREATFHTREGGGASHLYAEHSCFCARKDFSFFLFFFQTESLMPWQVLSRCCTSCTCARDTVVPYPRFRLAAEGCGTKERTALHCRRQRRRRRWCGVSAARLTTEQTFQRRETWRRAAALSFCPQFFL